MFWVNRFLTKVRNLKTVKAMKPLKQEKGAILTFFAIALTTLMAISGLAFDVGNLYMHKARLQNVADAAALAGAREYLNHDETEDGTSLAGLTKNSEIFTLTGSLPVRTGGNHDNADKAADQYIKHNIRNLGNSVKSDRYSHLALKAGGTEPKTYYRIGLSETVPLYFLPVLPGISKTQDVDAVAIAIVQPGTTTPGGGNSGDKVKNPSIFDNLFTYSDVFKSRHTSDFQAGQAFASFEGDMVYTHGNGNLSEYYSHQDLNKTKHLYTNHNSIPDNKINDPLIDTMFSTLDYLEALTTKKLEQKHNTVNKDQNNQPIKVIKASDLNNPNSNIFLTDIYGPNNEQVWKGRTNGTPYIYKDNRYYAVDEQGNYINVTYDGQQYPVYYCRLGDINNSEDYVRCVYMNGKYYIINTNNQITNCYLKTNGNTTKAYYGGVIEGIIDPEITYDSNQKDFYYRILFKHFVNIGSLTNDNFRERQDQDKYKGRIYTNIFYVNNNVNIDIIIDEKVVGVDGKDENEPIYIIIDPNVDRTNIYAYVSNERPIIIIDTGTNEIDLQIKSGATFSGVIYSPFASGGVHLKSEGTFKGNVISHTINMEDEGQSSWIQVNFLENYDGYTDPDVKAVTDVVEQKIKDANASLTSEIKKKIADALNGVEFQVDEVWWPQHEIIKETLVVTEANLGDLDWYNNLRYEAKQALYIRWKELYNSETNANIRNLLWPWNEHFDIGGEEGGTVMSEILRLINPRLEENPFTKAS